LFVFDFPFFFIFHFYYPGYEHTNEIGDDPNEMGSYLPFVDLGTGESVGVIGMGIWYSCAILKTLEMKCWGQNNSGELGLKN